MSLYYVQKLLYNLNRDPVQQQHFLDDRDTVFEHYTLTEEEIDALSKPDIGLLYVMGVNAQLLMHYATMSGYDWPQYIQAMRDGIDQYGPVREGLYAMQDGKGAI
tara:strand:+ start:261 stop:575 length:315 start_codon:yes stop_codon:yes gene_type:complete